MSQYRAWRRARWNFARSTLVTKLKTLKVSNFKIIRNYRKCEGGILTIIVWHHEVCWVMTNGDPQGWILYPKLTQNMDYFTCQSLEPALPCNIKIIQNSMPMYRPKGIYLQNLNLWKSKTVWGVVYMRYLFSGHAKRQSLEAERVKHNQTTMRKDYTKSICTSTYRKHLTVWRNNKSTPISSFLALQFSVHIPVYITSPNAFHYIYFSEEK